MGHSVKEQTDSGKAEGREGITQKRKADLKAHQYGVGTGLRSWGWKAPVRAQDYQPYQPDLSGLPHMPFHLTVAETLDSTPLSQEDTIPPHLHPCPLGVKGCQEGSPAHLCPEGAPLPRPWPSIRESLQGSPPHLEDQEIPGWGPPPLPRFESY